MLCPAFARADCGRVTFSRVMQCLPTHCVFALESQDVGDTQLVHTTTSERVALEAIEIDGFLTLFRAIRPLAVGRYSVGSKFVDVSEAPPPAMRDVRALGELRPPQSSACGDTFPPPPVPTVATESDYIVSVRLGRRPMANARADVWALSPGEAVPERTQDAFSLPSIRPTLQRTINNEEDPLCAACPTPSTFEVTLRGLPTNTDRVAIQIFEPHSESTDMLVVPLDDADDRRMPYLACRCARSDVGKPAVSACMLILGATALRRRSPHRRRTDRSRPGVPGSHGFT
jgi:hypothetical protein